MFDQNRMKRVVSEKLTQTNERTNDNDNGRQGIDVASTLSFLFYFFTIFPVEWAK